MFFIKKMTLRKSSPLSLQDQNILKRPHDYDHELRSELARRLLQLKETHWISCDCKAEDAIIVVCKRGNGDIYLRRRAKSDHAISCVFNQSDTELLPASSSLLPPIKRVKTFCLYNEPQEFSAISSQINNHRQSQNIRRLGQLLYTVLTESKVNIILPSHGEYIGKDYLETQLTSIKNIFKQKNINKDIPLDHFYHYILTNNSLQYAQYKLENPGRVIKQKWPPHIKPFILFLSISPSITSTSFSTKSMGILNTYSEIQCPSPWIDKKKSGPYVVLSSLVLNEDKKPIFQDAFAIPILSEMELVPVESSFERSILKIILGVVSEFKTNHFKIEKPLFCLTTETQQKYRPDFIIYGKNDTKIFIEVLGSPNEMYMAHKAFLANCASDYCEHYITVHGYNLKREYASFKDKLTTALKSVLQ